MNCILSLGLYRGFFVSGLCPDLKSGVVLPRDLMPMSDIQPKKEPAGIRWLAIFEQSASVVLAALVIGVFATYITVSKTNDAVNALAGRMDRFEQQTDSRIQNIERDVKALQIEQARYHRDGK